MNDFKELLSRTRRFLLSQGKSLAINHKKKLIAFVVLLIAGYVIKRKMTMDHLVSLIQSVSQLISYLPLPDSPKLRELSKYEHPNSYPLKQIYEAIKIQEIKSRIAKKEGTWQELKQQILTGAVLTLTLYNIKSFHFVALGKYLEEFKQLQALNHFEEAMHIIRKRFTDEIPLIFANLKATLQTEFDKLDLQTVYNLEELEEIIDRLISKTFEARYNVQKEYKKSIVHKSSPEAINLFCSHYEYVPEKKSVVKSVGLGALKFVGGFLNVLDWFPEAKPEITSQRYEFIKRSYLLSVFKADLEGIEWPNQNSKQLFRLVFEEITYSIFSLNFNVLVNEYSKYNKKILMNRIRLWFISSKAESVKLLKLLPALYKILKEEFFKSDIYEFRANYHEKELKRNIRQVSLDQSKEKSSEGEVDPISIEQQILKEVQQKKGFEYLEREFELKYFNERSGVVHRLKRAEEGKEANDMQKLLTMMGGNEILNQQE